VSDHLGGIGYASWAEPSSSPGGVTLHREDRSGEGIHLRADDRSHVLAFDMGGRVLWRIPVPGRTRCEAVAPLVGGGLAIESVDEGITVLDRDGSLLWSADFNAHHDVTALPGGGLLAPFWEEDPDYRGRRVRFDGLVWFGKDGREIRRWRTREHLGQLQELHDGLPLDRSPDPVDTQGDDAEVDRSRVYDYYHLNAAALLPRSDLGERDPRFRSGNLMLCLRNANLLVILDGETLEILWAWGPGTLDFPHSPSITAEGTLMVFDNGYHRGWSRVLEVDPVGGAVRWEYRGDPPDSFFSKKRGSCQRLPGGNTLIVESSRGRAFEVTPGGILVWEYLNPERRGEQRRRMYRLRRFPAEAVLPGIAPAEGGH